MLPAHQRVGLQVIDIGQRHVAADRAEYNPAYVRVKESLQDVVRIILVISVLVVAAVIGAPLERGVFYRRGPENEGEQPHRPLGLERQVGEESVITERDAQAGSDEHPDENRAVQPPVDLAAKVVEENWQTNEGG